MSKNLTGLRILVVEDELLILMMIENMLADLGCQSVISAATVDKAIALVDAEVFDAAILDMNLKGVRSHTVAEALVVRGVPFFYATGNNDLEIKHGYPDKPVLKKPFKQEELAEIFSRLFPT